MFKHDFWTLWRNFVSTSSTSASPSVVDKFFIPLTIKMIRIFEMSTNVSLHPAAISSILKGFFYVHASRIAYSSPLS